jgi:hypothetical protein
MPTGRTCSRGIPRIDQVDRHTTQLSFVADERPELRECPGVECCALRPPSLHPRANMRQVFQRNRPLRAFGLRNNPFGEGVVNPDGKSALLTRQVPQAPAAVLCAQPLQLVPEPPMPIAHVLDGFARMCLTVAIGCDIGHAQVDPKYIVTILGASSSISHVTSKYQAPQWNSRSLSP